MTALPTRRSPARPEVYRVEREEGDHIWRAVVFLFDVEAAKETADALTEQEGARHVVTPVQLAEAVGLLNALLAAKVTA